MGKILFSGRISVRLAGWIAGCQETVSRWSYLVRYPHPPDAAGYVPCNMGPAWVVLGERQALRRFRTELTYPLRIQYAYSVRVVVRGEPEVTALAGETGGQCRTELSTLGQGRRGKVFRIK